MGAVRQLSNPAEQEASFARISDIGPGRIAEMDRIGIDLQVLSLTAVSTELLEGDEAVRISSLTNDLLAQAVEANPERLRGFAALPTGVPERAADELRRRVAAGGFVGAIINGHIRGHYLDESQFDPLLGAAEELDAPLYIHPAIPPRAVMDTYYSVADPYAQVVLATGGWGWHIETGTHVLRLIASGAFDRHPGLKVIVGHLGEALPFFVDRLANATAGQLKHPYPDYLRSNVYYTTSGFNYPGLWHYVIEAMGSDRVMFSSDYPMFPAQEFPGMVDFVRTIDLEPDVREAVAHGNAERVLRL